MVMSLPDLGVYAMMMFAGSEVRSRLSVSMPGVDAISLYSYVLIGVTGKATSTKVIKMAKATTAMRIIAHIGKAAVLLLVTVAFCGRLDGGGATVSA